MDKTSNANRIEPVSFLPFSLGNKDCLGKQLVMILLKYFTVELLKNFELKKPVGFKIETESIRGVSSIKSLPILFERRKSTESTRGILIEDLLLLQSILL